MSAKLPGREGHQDRRLALELVNLVNKEREEKSSPTITINNSTSTKIAVQSSMPQWEGTVRKVEEVLLAHPQTQNAVSLVAQLPEPNPENVIDAKSETENSVPEPTKEVAYAQPLKVNPLPPARPSMGYKPDYDQILHGSSDDSDSPA
jgi:hypothetical protein